MREYTPNELSAAKMILKFFNLQVGWNLRAGSEDKPDSNIGRTLETLDTINFDVSALKAHIKEYVASTPESELSYTDCLISVKRPEPEVPVLKQNEEIGDQQVQYSMGILEQAVIQLISKTQTERIESEIMGQVEDKVKDFIKEEYGTIERKIVTVVDGKKVPMKGIQHEKFERVLKYVANDLPVFLTGPAGSGKNVLCKQVAEALGLKFYFTNAVTQEYKLTGFTDAMGNYQPTQFYKAFTEGGLFMLDEMDASIPEVLVILNAAIANRYFDFPAPIGFVKAHPDFRVIAAGNTFGQGASYEYVGRNQLDAASLNRFAIIKIDYSEAIENSVAQDIELANFCRSFRKACNQAGQQVVVSYRNIDMIAKMSQIMSLDEVLEDALVKGMEKDDLNAILGDIEDSKYKRALKTIIKRM